MECLQGFILVKRGIKDQRQGDRSHPCGPYAGFSAKDAGAGESGKPDCCGSEHALHCDHLPDTGAQYQPDQRQKYCIIKRLIIKHPGVSSCSNRFCQTHIGMKIACG